MVPQNIAIIVDIIETKSFVEESSGLPLFARLSNRWRQKNTTAVAASKEVPSEPQEGPPDTSDVAGHRTDSPSTPRQNKDSPNSLRHDTRHDTDSPLISRHDTESPVTPRYTTESPLTPGHDTSVDPTHKSNDLESLETKRDSPIRNHQQAPPTTVQPAGAERTRTVSSNRKKKVVEPTVSINDELTEEILQNWSKEVRNCERTDNIQLL